MRATTEDRRFYVLLTATVAMQRHGKHASSTAEGLRFPRGPCRDTQAEDISNSLDDLGFNVINARQMTANRRTPHGQAYVDTFPLFLITLTRNVKSHDIFKLNILNHIIVQVEPYRAHTGLTQCYNCENFGHVWANCKQPPPCLRYGCCHLHRECPEKTNTESTPRCCNCSLVEREKPHPVSFRICSHAKEEEHNELPRDSLGGRYSLSSPHQNSPT
jgi:hypothetical protein